MKTTIKDMVLKMWEKTMMPESEKIDGKYVKTGKSIEQTTYTFIDPFGDKLVFLSNTSGLRSFEGKTGDLIVSLSHDTFNKRNKISFVDFVVEN